MTPKEIDKLRVESLGRKSARELNKFKRIEGSCLRDAEVMSTDYHAERYDSKDRNYSKQKITESMPLFSFSRIGDDMEIDVKLLKGINKEALESRKILQELTNEIMVTQNLLEPQLHNMIKRLRNTRMTTTIELTKTLSIMKDVRKFFLEKEYKEEIERLEEFVAIGERLRVLINDGTFDKLTDSILRLAIGNPE